MSELSRTVAVPLEALERIRDQLHVMATTVVPNFCDMAAGLQGQVQELLDGYRLEQPETMP